MKTAACVTALLLGLAASAQNLVPNGSFEEYYNCPTTWGQWQQVQNWISPYNQSADYFNACTGDTIAGVPFSQFGYQHAVEGQAYMGLATYLEAVPAYREMIQVELSEPLVVGVPVCLSFKMAVGGFGSWGFINSARYTCKGVGMKFFEQLPTNWAGYLYPNAAALYLDEVPTDTAIWYAMNGTYVPDSAYTHLVIANFFADSLNGVTVLDSIGWGVTPWAYAFIDDVRVSFDLTFCAYTNSVAEHGPKELRVFPNPFSDRLEILCNSLNRGSVTLELLDAWGRTMMVSRHFSSDRIVLDLPSLPVGIYLLRVSDAHGVVHSVSVAHVSP
ncbi:MAG: T9SS type A sorting domain-containing protein [Flavobacteriales bacterium]|nr:T9SS type A sorting domain-containing protein [Flavobacteriales bacterium]